METVLQLIENMLLKIKQNSQKNFGAKIGVDPNVIWTQNFLDKIIFLTHQFFYSKFIRAKKKIYPGIFGPKKKILNF